MANRGSADFPAHFEEIPCPLCGARPFRSVYTVQDRLHPEPARTQNQPQEAAFRIVACSSCGFLYLNPRPNPEHLSEYYRSEKYDPHIRRGGGWSGRLYRWVRPFSIRRKAALVWKKREPGTLLDVGCGTGEFLHYMKRRGWRVLGVESDAAAAEQARAAGCDVLTGDPATVEYPDLKFDLITFWHALEHLPDLRGTLNAVAQRIKAGGILAVALPNPYSYDAEFYRSLWVAWDAPRHLYHFRRRDLEILLSAYNIRWSATRSLPLDPWYNALLSELSWASGLRALPRIFRGLGIGLISFLRGWKPGAGSSNLYLFIKE
jgi:SAM-dependent methyltransferase